MRGCNCVRVLIAAGFILQSGVESTFFDVIRAFISPETRVTRTRSGSPRAQGTKDPLAVLDFVGLVSQHDYPAEEYYVKTTDGYGLNLHRISGSPLSPPGKKKPIVFMQHGLLASSDTWVLRGPGRDLAFLLADAGYDVWLGNFRGNSYSRSHVSLSTKDPEFWKFSYHEMGSFDLPAMVDFALEKTGNKNLIYIGHSMGTTASYVLLSERPEYNERFHFLVSLAPVAYFVNEFDGVIKLAVINGRLIENTLRSGKIFELCPQSSFYIRLIDALCNDHAITQQACLAAISAPAGYDFAQSNASFLPYLAAYYPAGMSLNTLAHFRQNAVTHKFRQYDYGSEKNFQLYRQAEPPDYDLSKITAPVALIYGKNDLISRQNDGVVLAKNLANVVVNTAITWPTFNHIDFLWANDGKSLLYDDLIGLIDRVSRKILQEFNAAS